MNPRLERIINRIEDRSLRKKVIDLVTNPTVEIDGQVYAGLGLDRSPAGFSRHHSYPGGLLEHIVATAEIALTLCNIVKKVYRGKVDKDLVLCGVILHDIFKPLTYVEKEDGTYGSTPLAERLDHLTLIASELVRRGFPLGLIHIVSAHHGSQVGPIGPRTLEALICHLADSADSRLNGEVLRAARYLIKDATGEEPSRITSQEAFEIVSAKAIKGWKGVQELVEKTKPKS